MRTLFLAIGFWAAFVGVSYGATLAECISQRSSNQPMAPDCAARFGESPNSEFGVLTDQQRQDHVFFSKGGTKIDADASAQIARLAAILETAILTDACIQLIGHSDSSGSQAANVSISLKRAEAVERALGAQLSAPTRIASVLAEGEDRPLVNLKPTDRSQRRVEIRLGPCAL